MVPALLVLAVEFHRAPLRFGQLTDPTLQLPAAFGSWLLESCTALAPGAIQANAESLALSPTELRNAFLFLLRQTLLSPQADHYRVLGLPRDCSQDAIKRHHSLLVRMFHPDRNPTQNDLSVRHTARINAAYQALRDRVSRQHYDLGLPAPRETARNEATTQEFFRPRRPIPRSAKRSPSASRALVQTRVTILWIAACALAAGLLFLALREPDQPLLQINPRLAKRGAAGPSYLRRTSPENSLWQTQPIPDREITACSGSEITPAPRPEQEPKARQTTGVAASVPNAERDALEEIPGGDKEGSSNARAALDLVIRFQDSYVNRDLAGLLSLFTEDAVSDMGAGLAFIKAKYSGIFTGSGERCMSIFNLRWRPAANQGLLGTGNILTGIKPSPSGEWRHAAGMIEIELISWREDYKISKMVQRPSRLPEVQQRW